MAGFLGGFSTGHQNTMGAAGSARAINADDYNAMAGILSPNSRQQIPDTDTALSLLQDFEALNLADHSGGVGGRSDCSCFTCHNVLNEDSILNVGVQRDYELERSMSEQPFVFRREAFCCLDCFFERYLDKPGLCRYIDSLFTMAVKVARIKKQQEESEVKSRK